MDSKHTGITSSFTTGNDSTEILNEAKADSLLDFIAKNKKRSSLYLADGDSVTSYNETQLMPLAGTANMLMAVEFARQAGIGMLDELAYVPVSDIDKYYVANTDSNAYPKWLDYEKEKGFIKNDSIQMIEIARGMMIYNSNANTEFLQDVLGLDNINRIVKLFGIEHHTAIFPIVSSLFLYQNALKSNEKSVLKNIRNLSEENYCRSIYEIHKILKEDTTLKKGFVAQDITPKMQKLWSDRLPASTTKDYVELCKALNKRDKLLNDYSYAILSEVLETYMENSNSQSWLKHAGMEEGNSVSVLTKAFYLTTKKGETISMAYFFNDLTAQEKEKLQTWMKQFELKTMNNENFRLKIKQTLK